MLFHLHLAQRLEKQFKLIENFILVANNNKILKYLPFHCMFINLASLGVLNHILQLWLKLDLRIHGEQWVDYDVAFRYDFLHFPYPPFLFSRPPLKEECTHYVLTPWNGHLELLWNLLKASLFLQDLLDYRFALFAGQILVLLFFVPLTWIHIKNYFPNYSRFQIY